MKKPPQFVPTSLADVAGCLQPELKHTKPLSLADMDNALAKHLSQAPANIRAQKPHQMSERAIWRSFETQNQSADA